MHKLDSASLMCLEIASLALGYRILNEITIAEETGGVKLISASPAAHRLVILASGPTEVLARLLKKVHASIHSQDIELISDQQIVEKDGERILEALHSLLETPLGGALIVAECQTLSALLAAAETMVSGHGVQPIELKLLRSGRGGAYGFFTAPAQHALAAAEDARTHLKNRVRKGRIEVIDSPSRGFRRFFNLSGDE